MHSSGTFTLRTGEESFSIEVDDERRLEMTNDGELIENSLAAEDVALIGRFREDSLLELDAMGFRTSGMDCLGQVGGAGIACAGAYAAPSWPTVLGCAYEGAGAVSTCYDWATGPGQGQPGQDGGGQDGGGQDGGGQDGGIARRQMFLEFKQRQTRGEIVAPSEASIRDVHTSPSGAVARLDEQKIFLVALEGLPTEFRSVIERFYWEEQPITVIAQELGVATGTVKSRLFRGKALLRERLEQLRAPAEIRDSATKVFEQKLGDLERE